MSQSIRRLVLIESSTGYVWGEAVAADIVQACRAVDAGIDPKPREYEEISRDPRDSSGYYTVYDATGSDLPPVTDGQDRSTIAAVAALPVAGYVRSTRMAD